MKAFKEQILNRMVEQPKYLQAWRTIRTVIQRDKRHSFRAWLFCHQMIEKAEKLLEKREKRL